MDRRAECHRRRRGSRSAARGPARQLQPHGGVGLPQQHRWLLVRLLQFPSRLGRHRQRQLPVPSGRLHAVHRVGTRGVPPAVPGAAESGDCDQVRGAGPEPPRERDGAPRGRRAHARRHRLRLHRRRRHRGAGAGRVGVQHDALRQARGGAQQRVQHLRVQRAAACGGVRRDGAGGRGAVHGADAVEHGGAATVGRVADGGGAARGVPAAGPGQRELRAVRAHDVPPGAGLELEAAGGVDGGALRRPRALV
mmetsp:Transcript_30548/g.94356  ORF Transcript_30548/g.94356 Transcript_30548/m.94356 type:complete len:251 (-) Transcript_30548:120-872(-)